MQSNLKISISIFIQDTSHLEHFCIVCALLHAIFLLTEYVISWIKCKGAKDMCIWLSWWLPYNVCTHAASHMFSKNVEVSTFFSRQFFNTVTYFGEEEKRYQTNIKSWCPLFLQRQLQMTSVKFTEKKRRLHLLSISLTSALSSAWIENMREDDKNLENSLTTLGKSWLYKSHISLKTATSRSG